MSGADKDTISPWTDSDLDYRMLTPREKAAAFAIGKHARAYGKFRRYRWDYAYMRAVDMLAPVLRERRPLILAHAILRHPGLAEAWALLRDAGADVAAVDAIVTASTGQTRRRKRQGRRRWRRVGCRASLAS